MSALWVFAPVLGAPIVHAPILRWDLFPRLKLPLDRGAHLRGRRLFGANKTLRGMLAMVGGVVAAAALLSLWPWYWHKLPGEIEDAGPWLYGLLLGMGVVLGELPNSFIKRQLGIPPGERRRSAAGALISVYDQGDFVPAVWLLLLPIWKMSVGQAAIAFVVVSAVHVPINLIGYELGARKAPI